MAKAVNPYGDGYATRRFISAILYMMSELRKDQREINLFSFLRALEI